LHINSATTNAIYIDVPAISNAIFINRSDALIRWSDGASFSGKQMYSATFDQQYITFDGTNTQVRLQIKASNGNVGIGTTTDAGYKLDVNGNTRVKGSGATSATTALRVENTNASVSLVVLDNGYVGIGTASAAYNLDVSGSTMLRGITYGVGSGGAAVQLLSTVSTNIGVVGGNASNPLRLLGQYLQFYVGNTQMGLFQPTTGNFVLQNGGTFLDAGYRLDVIGTTRLSAATGTSLTVISSGNSTSTPVFSVQGSQGELFSVTDSLTGSLFSVSDISGLPIMEVFSDSTIVLGDYQAPSLYTTKRVTSITASTGTTIYSFPTSAYTSSFVDYFVSGSTGLRAGNLMAIWSGSTVNFTETSTNDIGTTTPVTFGYVMSGSSAVLRASASTGTWIVESILRGL
jgi:hypothetical protein